MRSPAHRAACARVGALRAGSLIVFLLLAGRAAHLTVVDERGAGRGAGQVQTSLRLPPSRGMILDRDGVELAVSVSAPSVYVMPAAIDDGPGTARALASALGLDVRDVRRRLQGRENFTFIERWIGEERAGRVDALDLAGVGIVREARRAYPGNELAAAVLGFANIDGEGVRGIEQLEDPWLRGSPQLAAVQRDGSGRLLAATGLAPRNASGGDVQLALDSKMQAQAERALAAAIARTGARGGSVVTLDPWTGDLLAVAEAPGFDPNRFRETDYEHTRARSFLDAVEPGSTFKVFLVAAGLDNGSIRRNESLDCSDGWMRIPGKTIRDARDFGVLDIADILRLSSNVGAVKIAERVGAAAYHAALERFGFGRVTGSGFPVESSGLVRPWQEWKPVDQAAIAFGQGVNVTSIQLAAATAALANGGQWRAPRLVTARRLPGRGWKEVERTAPHTVVSAEAASAVLSMMEGVVSSSGTARLAALDGVRVAGKTGTAQKLDPITHTYSKDHFIAWFIGVAPADDPKLVWVAALDEPRLGTHHGGTAAGPLFADVAAAQLGRLGIQTHPAPLPRAVIETRVASTAPSASNTPAADTQDSRTELRLAKARNPAAVKRVEVPKPRPQEFKAGTQNRERAVSAGPNVPAAPQPAAVERTEVVRTGDRLLLPDFSGLSLEQVMRITSENSLELQVRGRGRAVEQQPLPGTILDGAHRQVFVRFAPRDTGES